MFLGQRVIDPYKQTTRTFNQNLTVYPVYKETNKHINKDNNKCGTQYDYLY